MTELPKSGRVRRSHHRQEDAHLARGLDLPPPAPKRQCLFAGHCKMWQRADTKWMKQATFATGCSVWYALGNVRQDNPAAKCMCGLALPSRPHLMWNCPETEHKRIGLPHPTNRASERLLAIAVPEFPKAPATMDLCQTLAKVTDAFAKTDFRHGSCLVATDGSMLMDVAACALIFPGAGIEITAGLPGEDQTAFRAEARGNFAGPQRADAERKQQKAIQEAQKNQRAAAARLRKREEKLAKAQKKAEEQERARTERAAAAATRAAAASPSSRRRAPSPEEPTAKRHLRVVSANGLPTALRLFVFFKLLIVAHVDTVDALISLYNKLTLF
eukprot:s3889_g3.t1